jgi:LPXTG-site transpeptidase (sortase) family protein
VSRPLTVRRALSSLLIGLGLFVSLAAAASGLADASRSGSPYDQADGSELPNAGFEPILVPEAGLVEPRGAPTLLPSTSGNPIGEIATTSPPTATPTASSVTQPSTPAVDSPAQTATNLPIWVPNQIVIPAIGLDAPIVPAHLKEIMYLGIRYQQWLAPDSSDAGWHTTSATLGLAGNTVINGHHNVYGEVFGHLADLELGDYIWVFSDAEWFTYRIAMITILPERWQQAAVRLENARWIEPSLDERLTLITCWPYASNTHRLIIVALPVHPLAIEDYQVVPRVTPHPDGN